MDRNFEELVQLIKDRNVILFAGAGVSATLKLPTFKNLIAEIAKQMNFEPEIFDLLGNGDFLTLAEYYKVTKGTISELRSWMDINWHNQNIDITSSKIHKAICELDFPIIYTTNYDRWIERSYDIYSKEYKKIKNVTDMKYIKEGTPQIVKFHGDFDDDSSIVLTESSYFERLDFETPLDIKLRSDILGKSLLFIGYSLDDINIRFLLHKLTKLWGNSIQPQLRPKSFVFFPRPNQIKRTILESKGIGVLTSDEDDLSLALEKFLFELYEKVKTKEPL